MKPLVKQMRQLSTHVGRGELEISEVMVFKMLDGMRMTSSGPDDIPAWFLRLAAPILAKPLAQDYNLLLRSSTVPSPGSARLLHLWERSRIL